MAKVKDAVRVCYPIEDFDYGMREFAIFDNNGYLLQFGQEIDAAQELADPVRVLQSQHLTSASAGRVLFQETT